MGNASPGSRYSQTQRNSGGGVFGRDDWINFELDDVAPVRDPLIEKFGISCFNYLEAALKFLIIRSKA
jgi:hypothetical protein